MGIIFDALKQKLGPFDESYSLSSYKERGNEPKWRCGFKFFEIAVDLIEKPPKAANLFRCVGWFASCFLF